MSKSSRPEKLFLDGPAGRLEALLERPDGSGVRGSALVCHPHPLHEGTMLNKVTHTLARAFLRCGLSVLRFNFRGVGASAGDFDEGRGELEDARAGLGYLRNMERAEALWVAGFSFGAVIAIRAAASEPVSGLISVAPAVTGFMGRLDPQPSCPWLILHGAEDEVAPADDTIAWINELEPGPELRVFPDTGHFFHGKLVELREAAEAFIAAQQPG